MDILQLVSLAVCADIIVIMSSQDIDNIMGNLTKFATDYLAMKGESKKKSVTEIQPFILALLKEHTKLMVEYTDTKISNYEEELEKRDIKIANLKSELRVHRNDHDALGYYNRRENIKIQGIEFTQGEDTNAIVKEICKYAGREITDMDILQVIGMGLPNPILSSHQV